MATTINYGDETIATIGNDGGTKILNCENQLMSAPVTVSADAVPVTSVAGKTGDVTLVSSDVGLGNVGNFKAVSTVASQGLNDTEKGNARANIEAIANAGTPLNCTLPTTGWDNNSITVSCSGLISTDNVMVSPAPSSFTEYSSCGIYCSAIGTDTATFIRSKENENSLTVNIYKLA